MAHWHALAKLRLHTDITLAAMDSMTVLLGNKLRLFQRKTCSAFSTQELKRERDARVRRQNPKTKTNDRPTATPRNPPVRKSTGASTRATTAASRTGPSSNAALDHDPSLTTPLIGSSKAPDGSPGPARCDEGSREKTFNLNTYKFHALGDYAATIRQFGTTDSYSTEMVCPSHTQYSTLLTVTRQSELEHRTPKRRYIRTSRKGFTKQLTHIERRQACIRRLREEMASTGSLTTETVASTHNTHHNIGKSQNYPVAIGEFLQKYADDPAVKVGSAIAHKGHPLLINSRIFCPNSRSICFPASMTPCRIRGPVPITMCCRRLSRARRQLHRQPTQTGYSSSQIACTDITC